MATGQRVEEILRVRDDTYDRAEKMIFWDKTKNGLPHSIPVPDVAVRLLSRCMPNEHGWFFPHKRDASRHSISTTPNKLCAVYAEEMGVERFTPRDLRRTWKTLAGRAGISKELRDRLQNHTRTNDVSSRHYDRYDYWREKQEAMEQWNNFLERLLKAEFDTSVKRSLRQAA